jgi:hypothetical protein
MQALIFVFHFLFFSYYPHLKLSARGLAVKVYQFIVYVSQKSAENGKAGESRSPAPPGSQSQSSTGPLCWKEDNHINMDIELFFFGTEIYSLMSCYKDLTGYPQKIARSQKAFVENLADWWPARFAFHNPTNQNR